MIRWVPALLIGASFVAIASWNLAIAWDFIDTGRREGDTIGSTGRYVDAHDDGR